MIEPVRLDDAGVALLDQRLLPHEERWITCGSVDEVAEAIRVMVVRGAPAIGFTAACGMAVAARQAGQASPENLLAALEAAAGQLIATRPTAVNLEWAVRRVLASARDASAGGTSGADLLRRVEDEARAIGREDVEANRTLGRHGSLFVPDGARVLTYCNAGALATAGYGTALGIIRAAHEEGKKLSVFTSETRPRLQGARLTAWELVREGIPATLITDSMVGALMARGEIDLVITGADRIAINGDVANKIGTYTVAVLARRHGIPFYVAAPNSTIDPDCADGSGIPIEERDPEEVTHIGGQRIAAEGVAVRNLAFDVTPAALVTAIVTEAGVARAPYDSSLRRALGLAIEEDEEVPADVEHETPVATEEEDLEEQAAGASDDDDDGAGDDEELFS